MIREIDGDEKTENGRGMECATMENLSMGKGFGRWCGNVLG